MTFCRTFWHLSRRFSSAKPSALVYERLPQHDSLTVTRFKRSKLAQTANDI